MVQCRARQTRKQDNAREAGAAGARAPGRRPTARRATSLAVLNIFGFRPRRYRRMVVWQLLLVLHTCLGLTCVGATFQPTAPRYLLSRAEPYTVQSDGMVMLHYDLYVLVACHPTLAALLDS